MLHPVGQGQLPHLMAKVGNVGLQSEVGPRGARISRSPGPVCTPHAEGIQSNSPEEPGGVQPAECPAPSQSGPLTGADTLCKMRPAGLSGCSRNLLEDPGANSENAGRLVPGLSEPRAQLDTQWKRVIQHRQVRASGETSQVKRVNIRKRRKAHHAANRQQSISGSI